MRVDSDILRQMLERVEEVPRPELGAMPALGQDREVWAYHLRVLIWGGCLVAKIDDGEAPRCLSLTLDGQRLLDELRAAPPVARAVGEGAARVAIGLLFSVLLAKLRATGLALEF